MREIIHLQIGDCGNAIGNAYWWNIFNDYSIKNSQALSLNFNEIQEKIGIYLEEKSNQEFIARNISIHTENDALNPKFSSYFSPNDFVKIDSAGNNFGKGFHDNGVDEYIINLGKSKAEACDSLQGFEISHNLGGGSGSGLTSKIIEMLKDEFPEILISTHTIFPYCGMADCVIEPYNIALSFPYIHMPKNMIFALQNEKMINIIFKQQRRNPTFYDDMSNLASKILSGITSSLRFPGTMNGDLQKMAWNLTPIETMNFLVPESIELSSLWLNDTLSRSLGASKDLLCNIDNIQKYIAMACNFRGCENSFKEIQAFFNSETNETINRMPKNKIKYSMIDTHPTNFKMEAFNIINTTGFSKTLSEYLKQYFALKRRNAFLHWFYNEGVEDEDFNIATNEIHDLIETYENVNDS